MSLTAEVVLTAEVSVRNAGFFPFAPVFIEWAAVSFHTHLSVFAIVFSWWAASLGGLAGSVGWAPEETSYFVTAVVSAVSDSVIGSNGSWAPRSVRMATVLVNVMARHIVIPVTEFVGGIVTAVPSISLALRVVSDVFTVVGDRGITAFLGVNALIIFPWAVDLRRHTAGFLLALSRVNAEEEAIGLVAAVRISRR